MNVGYPTLEGAAIPGEPGGLDAIASQLQSASTDIASVQERVAVNGLQGSWTGHAADAFRSSLDKLPGELGTVARAFEAASDSVRGFAGQLADFQSNASYCANRIRALEEDLQSAQRRHDEAQARVESARLRESVASDPISLKTAVDAVKDGLSQLRLALDDLEASHGELQRIRREAQNNREDYEQAVRACGAALLDATESTTHSNGAPHIAVGTLIAGIIGTLLRDIRNQEPSGKAPARTTTPTPPAKTPQKAKSAPTQPAVAATGTSATASTAIAWARQHLGTSYDDGECLAFVGSAYAAAGVNIGHAPSAADYWYTNPQGYTEHPGDTHPPIGALVFWGPDDVDGYSNPYGHVGIYVGTVPGYGSDMVISTASWPEPTSQPDVHYFSLSAMNNAGYPYLGWMAPPA
jgi:uncharacterized protein YukE/surface antigen